MSENVDERADLLSHSRMQRSEINLEISVEINN